MPSDRSRRLLFAFLILVVIVAILYLRGTFDPLLYRFGLNHNPCTHEPSGHVTCGSNVVGTPYGFRSPAGSERTVVAVLRQSAGA